MAVLCAPAVLLWSILRHVGLFLRAIPKNAWNFLKRLGIKLNSLWEKTLQKIPKKSEIEPRRPPRLLTGLGIAFQMVIHISVIITVATLWDLSNKRTGIMKIPNRPEASYENGHIKDPKTWKEALVWTVLPSLIGQIFTSIWGAMLDGLKSQMPILEMTKSEKLGRWRDAAWKKNPVQTLPTGPAPTATSPPAKASTVNKALLRDYGEPAPVDSWNALFGWQPVLLACTAAKFFLMTASALAAMILTPAPVPKARPVSLQSEYIADEWALVWDDSSIRPAFDYVSAHMIHGGGALAWTTNTSSFRPFGVPADDAASKQGPYSITAETTAHALELDCVDIDLARLWDENGIETEFKNGTEFVGNQTALSFSFNDRGCDARISFVATHWNYAYALTDASSCTLAANRSRLVFITAEYSGHDDASAVPLRDARLSSCIPTYLDQVVEITVPFSGGSADTAGAVEAVRVKSNDTHRPDSPLYNDFHSQVREYVNHDPILNDTDYDLLGYLAVQHADLAAAATGGTAAGGAEIHAALQDVVAAVYAAFFSLEIFRPLSVNGSLPEAVSGGEMSREEYRLFIVIPTAATVVAIYGATFLLAGYMYLYVRRRRALLGLFEMDCELGHAAFVNSSLDLQNYCTDAEKLMRNAPGPKSVGPGERSLVNYAKRNKQLLERKVWIDVANGPVVRVAAAKPGPSIPLLPIPSSAVTGATAGPAHSPTNVATAGVGPSPVGASNTAVGTPATTSGPGLGTSRPAP